VSGGGGWPTGQVAIEKKVEARVQDGIRSEERGAGTPLLNLEHYVQVYFLLKF
jgi:hypothetical protein